MSTDQMYLDEQERLQATLDEIQLQWSGIGKAYYGDDFLEQVLSALRAEDRQRLELLLKEPYFGRMDIQEEGQDLPVPLYIGKRGMNKRETEEAYIVDWRAPVASLFYTFTGGDEEVQYEAPIGTVTGLVHRKRNLVIRDQALERVVESYVRGGINLGVRDEFLLYRLGENKDNRLRDIVSTIQAEQDRIIRAPRHAALIIQGAAGSGKTTVALHRLAFLLYQYREQMRAERMIIFAPNAMFLDYISGVLPELGVGNIQQTTFAKWALELLEHQVKLQDEQEELTRRFSIGKVRLLTGDDTQERYKGSLVFKKWIEQGLELFESRFLPDLDFSPWERSRLSASMIREWFDVEYRHYPLGRRRERLVARMRRWLETELSGLDPELRGGAAKSGKQKLQAYLKKIPDADAVAFYKMIFGLTRQADWIDDEWLRQIPERIVDSTRAGLKRGVVRAEDLPPLLWIRQAFYGVDGAQFDHVVVDEAQDMSPFQIAVLNGHMREPSFTILGDLAQGIFEFRGIRRWEELSEVFAAERTVFHQLRQSYRSTTEIIEFANSFLRYAAADLPPAEPVFRSGDPVSVVRLERRDDRIRHIGNFVRDCLQQGMRTVSVIGRTADECRELHLALVESGTDALLIDASQTRYLGGISVVPVYLAKGLEFDAVLLVDVDEEHYTDSSQDAKLLYVGCTRALHRLELIYCGEASPLLG